MAGYVPRPAVNLTAPSSSSTSAAPAAATRAEGPRFRLFDRVEVTRAHAVVLHLKPSISAVGFRRVLEFCYTGSVDLAGRGDALDETVAAAEAFGCEELVTICDNVRNGDEWLNPSIATFVNDRVGERAKQRFMNRPHLADVVFHVGPAANPVYAHLPVLQTRCRALYDLCRAAAATAGADGSENEPVVVPLVDADLGVFLVLIEFIYSAHAPVVADTEQILEAAHRFGLTRLITLCELQMSKNIDAAVADSIVGSAINVAEALNFAAAHDADQLVAFLRHFLASNFEPLSAAGLVDDVERDADRDWIAEHRWPPLAYLEGVERYETELAAWNKRNGGGEGGSGSSNNNNCSIM